MPTIIKITGKKRYEKDKYIYHECLCNGIQLGMRYEKTEDSKRIAWDDKHCIQALKNSCKMMKLFGDPQYKNCILYGSPEELKMFRECDLPEWDG